MDVFDEEIVRLAGIHAIPVRFLHYDQLIASKRAPGRTKDFLDIEELEKIRKESS